jgi:hypothetical protein
MSWRIDTAAVAVVLWVRGAYSGKVSYGALSVQHRTTERAFRLGFHRIAGID